MRFDAIVFDIDNVLVDTRASYTDCIRKTVETYLQTVFGFQRSREPLLTRAEIECFKSLGGFNDDWDACYGLLLYFLSLEPKRRTLRELAKQKSIPQLAAKIKSRPLGVTGAERRFGTNEKVSTAQIEDIFQRLYLSEFVWNERLLLSKTFLAKLRRLGLKLGIVTGRNGDEAGFALRRFQIDSFIDAIVTTDETPRDKRKPSPFGLLKIASVLGGNLRYLYVGDLPDDILAAKKARSKIKISSCGYLAASGHPAEMKRQLKKTGASYLCSKPSELKSVILKR